MRPPGNDRNARQDVLDAMVELGSQQVLPRLCMFAFGYVNRQAPQPDKMPGAVKLGLCRFFQPRFQASGRK